MLMVKISSPMEYRRWIPTNFDEIKEFAKDYVYFSPKGFLIVRTASGEEKCCLGDYIFKDGNGNFYPVSPEIVTRHYRSAEY
jgi:hypothetical protein